MNISAPKKTAPQKSETQKNETPKSAAQGQNDRPRGQRGDRTGEHPFYSAHTHGLIRVATSTPQVRTADVGYNRDAILDEAKRAHDAQVDLVVYPELCLSSYAIDDLHLQGALLDAVADAVGAIVDGTRDLNPVILIGAPLRHNGKIYNCALAIANGELLGVVPKSYLPNYREFYEKRWFAHGRNVTGQTIEIAGRTVPFGVDLIFAASNLPGFRIFAEICEDFWSPDPPSSTGALAGATIIANLSASNVTIGKSDERHLLARAQSSRTISAYAYSASGHGESTTDLAWDGQGMIYELGDLLVESVRFDLQAELCIADVDCDRILLERMRNQTFADAAEAAGNPENRFRIVPFEHCGVGRDTGLRRPVPPFSLRARPRAQAGRRLLRSIQHSGRQPDAADERDRGEKSGHRYFGRAGQHPCANRGGARL